jgi:hypothetical protein
MLFPQLEAPSFTLTKKQAKKCFPFCTQNSHCHEMFPAVRWMFTEWGFLNQSSSGYKFKRTQRGRSKINCQHNSSKHIDPITLLSVTNQTVAFVNIHEKPFPLPQFTKLSPSLSCISDPSLKCSTYPVRSTLMGVFSTIFEIPSIFSAMVHSHYVINT